MAKYKCEKCGATISAKIFTSKDCLDCPICGGKNSMLDTKGMICSVEKLNKTIEDYVHAMPKKLRDRIEVTKTDFVGPKQTVQIHIDEETDFKTAFEIYLRVKKFAEENKIQFNIRVEVRERGWTFGCGDNYLYVPHTFTFSTDKLLLFSGYIDTKCNKNILNFIKKKDVIVWNEVIAMAQANFERWERNLAASKEQIERYSKAIENLKSAGFKRITLEDMCKAIYKENEGKEEK